MKDTFKEKSKTVFDTIENLLKKDISEDDSKKIVARLIDVLAEHNLTYDQAYNILILLNNTLAARAMIMKL